MSDVTQLKAGNLDAGKGLFRRLPIDQLAEPAATEGTGLVRSLSLFQLTAIGVGGIIGAGIFSLAGVVAHDYAGPAVLISFLIAGVASAAAAFSYAEFAGLISRAGSAYTYGYAVLGELPGWIIGWDLLLEYTAIVAVVGIGISGYFGYLVSQLGLHLPAWMMGAPGTGQGHVVDLFALLLCLFIAWLLTQGIRNAARFETFVVGLKVAVVVLIIAVGAFHISTANYTPFMPHGIGGAFTGAATVFFAVFGYDAMSTAAEESKDSQKHMPKAIVLSLLIAMVLYVLACLVLTGMVPYTDIVTSSPFSSAFASIGLPWLGTVIAAGAIVGILTVMFTFMLGVTRVWFSMSRDGLLPKYFAQTSVKHHVPVRVTWIVGVASALLAGFVKIGTAAELTNIGILFAFILVCVAVIVLRYRRPDLHREFKCPWLPVVPAIGVVASIWLITYLQWQTWVRFAVWLVAGLVIYFAYSRHHSRLADPLAAQEPPLPEPASLRLD